MKLKIYEGEGNVWSHKPKVRMDILNENGFRILATLHVSTTKHEALQKLETMTNHNLDFPLLSIFLR